MSQPDHETVWKEFGEAVNMAPAELERWLATEESRSVGWSQDGEGESVGHREGRRIVEIKHRRKADLTEDDYAHMRKVVGYVRRHLAQGGPETDKAGSRWRYSLMNWGHDPLKD
ncbi:DUF3140 domain-containing protein [Methylobacterium isbiliense]|uniref:DNA-binding protein n=1 Tax=Methylobacterium isbiliense TaxID=315478 RepID=A0ABQ4SFP5_9HYPH|nr:DUF3140 domain-containing protein [Methylobacterium isbiliense]MDN3625632.1 DUF3140 domain-containing protein [Methylobacterium isbiliense]GJE01934.1 hypothetical protein GMJLKIPL_3876 [Methylobacterium isbiliense]